MNTKRSPKFTVRPITRKFQPPKKTGRRGLDAEQSHANFVGKSASSDLQTIVALFIIALLLIINFILRFPDLGAIIAQYNQF